MLTLIGIANFKAYGEEMQSVPVGRITVLLGPNSGGKSSFCQALLVLRQGWLHRDWECRDRAFRRAYGLDLGGFASYVYRHDLERRVEWLMEFAGEQLPAGLGRWLGVGADALAVRVSVGLVPGSAAEARVLGLTVSLGGRCLMRLAERDGLLALSELLIPDPLVEADVLRAAAEEGFDPRFEGHELARIAQAAADYEANRGQRCSDIADLFRRHLKVDPHGMQVYLEEPAADEAAAYTWQADPIAYQLNEQLFLFAEGVMAHAAECMSRALTGTDYLRAARLVMDRDGQISESAMQSHVESEQGMVARLAADRGTLAEVNKFLDEDPGLTARYRLELTRPLQVADADLDLDDAALGRRVRERLAREGGDPRLRLVDTRNETAVSFHDIGSGIVSILRQLGFACRASAGFLMIEEPDASHHPMLQARLADLYISRTRMPGRPAHDFLLETHSPYIVQGLLKRVRQTWNGELHEPTLQLTAPEVSIVYVEAASEGTLIRPIGISDDGFLLDQVPDGFLYKQSELRFS